MLALSLLAGCVTTETAEKNYDEKVSEVVLAAAVEAERSYDYQNAVRHFETLYERDKTNPKILRDLARNLRYADSPKKAVGVLKDGMKTIGPAPELVLELAKAQLAASELADAHDTLDRATALKALSNDWQFHMVKGLYRDRVGQFAPAQEEYARALDLSPNNVAVLNNMALSLALSGNIDKGIDMLRKIVGDDASTRQTRQNLALLYGITGKMDDAAQLAKRDLPDTVAEKNLRIYRDFRE